MSDSESDMDSLSMKSGYSYKFRSSISSRSESTSKPTTPVSDCARCRNAMHKLQKLEILSDGYKKFWLKVSDYVWSHDFATAYK
ncbi:hypothetical protein TNCV_1289941 [Trichonephila clavipes]|nr:hypothetical protein TNCV_1289941 [Trichonephila clavipes]